jgi:hypothetical protein
MKNIIKYFYNLKIETYKKNESKFIFVLDGMTYEFVEYYGNVDLLINIYNVLRSNLKKCYEIIKNKNNQIITLYENKPYILMKKNCYIFGKNIIDNIIDYNNFIFFDGELKWKNLWTSKLDYYIEKINENDIYEFKYSFCYYSALCETAINLINHVDKENIKFGIAHIRIENSEDIINPLNIIIDNRVRDLAEYIKQRFFKEEKNDYNILNILKTNEFSNEEVILFFYRLLYPSYFFDEFELYLKDGIYTDKLKKILKKNTSYEEFLIQTYNEIIRFYNIPQIEFLQN